MSSVDYLSVMCHSSFAKLHLRSSIKAGCPSYGEQKKLLLIKWDSYCMEILRPISTTYAHTQDGVNA